MIGQLFRYARPLVQACVGTHVDVAGARVEVSGSLAMRLSVVAGNLRIHRLIDAAAGRGATVVDVGANIGYNTVYAARRVTGTGRVIAIEPAPDNLAVLQRNIAVNNLHNVAVKAIAAGRDHGTRDFFLRGEISAVNSFFPESCYAAVTSVTPVTVAPLDDLVDGDVALVKIDVEGAELDVLAGMPRLLRRPGLHLIVEWHPVLQEAAGYAADELPLTLIAHGFTLHAASHTKVIRLDRHNVLAVATRLRGTKRPVELVAEKSG
jgi:FkbM family methyltransferase